MDSEEHSGGSFSCFDYVLTVLSFFLVILLMPVSLCCAFKVHAQTLQEHEEAVIFRLGRQLPEKPKGPDEKRGVLRCPEFGGLSLYPSAN